MLMKLTRSGTYSDLFHLVGLREGVLLPEAARRYWLHEGDKKLLAKQFLSNPLVLMMVLNIARMGLIWLRANLQDRNQARAIIDKVVGAITGAEDVVSSVEEIKRQLESLRRQINSGSEMSAIQSNVDQLIEQLDNLMSRVRSGTPQEETIQPDERLRKMPRTFILLRSWLC
jgi:uncharacterized Zn finger protein